MKKYQAVIFDDIIHGGADVYTQAVFNELLGSTDLFGAQVIVDNADVAGSITVQAEHSGDGKTWVPKNINGGTPPATVAEINLAPLVTSATNSDVRFTMTSDGSDTSPRPLLPCARLRIRLTTTTRAHVKIIACGRDK